MSARAKPILVVDIARDVRSQTVASWSEDHMFRCLAWLYNGFALPAGLHRP